MWFFVLLVLVFTAYESPAETVQIPTAEVHHLFDLEGGAGRQFSLPTDVAVGRDGRIFVVDSGHHRVVAFDKAGGFLFEFGRQGKATGEFDGPVGIAADSAGRVYVADRGNRRIQIFDESGGFQSSFPVSSDGQAVHPVDVAVDPAGERLYVTGNDNHAVMSFTTDGKSIKQWGGEGLGVGQFRYPASITVSPDNTVYVVDVLNTRVQVFDASGEFLVMLGKWGVLPGQFFRPKGVAIDTRQRVYVSDSYMQVIEVFDNEARFLHVLGKSGQAERTDTPTGIVIDAADRLYVAEMLGNRVSVFALGR